MRFFSIIISTFILFTVLVSSCEEKEDFSYDSHLRIEFSKDTVNFDTVFTTIGSSYKRIMIYNRNNKSLTISSAKVMNPEKSGFSMSLDGFWGTDVRDTDILKKDSSFMFIMVKVDPNNSNNPLIIRDSIQFEINGSFQYLQLEAIGQNVHFWHGKTISQDTTLVYDKPILVYDSLVIEKNATLNIDKNVRLFFHSGAGIKVFGKINAKGTHDEPIIFRGDRTDRFFENVPYDRIPGQWEGMTIDSLSFGNHFEHFHLRNSISGIVFEPSNLSERKATLKNSIIHNTQFNGIDAQNADIYAENSLFTNAGGVVMNLVGGKYEFIHCTLANYQSWISGSRGVVALSNKTGQGSPAPLIKADFTNTIIASSGSRNDVTLNEEKDIPFQYLFTNCLFTVGGEDDANFIDSVWRAKTIFKNVNKDKDYFYDFTLDDDSEAINKGDFVKGFLVPLDMIGNSRISDEGPDIGCYEWISISD